MPVWRGESLLGKTITVQAEQGFGDIIQYARFLPFLKVMGAKSVVLLQHRLFRAVWDLRGTPIHYCRVQV